MPDLSLRQIEFHSDLVSKPVRDNFTDTENAINNLQDQIDLLTTTPGGTEVPNARDYHTVLRDRLRSDSLGRGNVLVSGGVVTAQGSPNMTVAVSAGEAVIGGIACKWTSQNSGTITAPTTGRYDVVVINSDNTLSILSGNDSADKVLPDVSSTQKALAVITLASSTTSITNSLIRDCSEQGCHANGHYFWKIQDAVDSLNDRTNELDEGEIVIHKGNYYEEVILTAFSNVTLRYDGGARHYRPSATKRCIKSINTAGNEETFIKIIGGQFYGNSKSGAIENLRFEYTDYLFIDGCFSDGNTSASSTYKDLFITNCDKLNANNIRLSKINIDNSSSIRLSDSIFSLTNIDTCLNYGFSNCSLGTSTIASSTDDNKYIAIVKDKPSNLTGGQVFKFQTVIEDERSLYSISNGTFTVDRAGIYKIEMNTRGALTNGAGGFYLDVNGGGNTDDRWLYYEDETDSTAAPLKTRNGSFTIKLSSGDAVKIVSNNTFDFATGSGLFGTFQKIG